VLQAIGQRYNIRHIIDLYEIDLDLDLFRTVIRDVAGTVYDAQDRVVVLYQDTDYCEPSSQIGHTLFNFFKLSAEYGVVMDRVIILTNHHGCTAAVQHLCETLCNTAAPKIIETMLWFDFPQQYQIPQWREPQSAWNTLYVCPNNQHRRHRVFLLACLAEASLLEQGSVSWNFAHAS
jgi:hypothetical protein